MNIVEFNGGSRAERELILEAIQFSIEQLMPRMKSLYIEVNLRKMEESYTGLCYPTDYKVKARDFEIELQKGQTENELVSTVMHEMVHCKQYARGELYQSIRTNRLRWKGVDHMGTPYQDQPWEEEAYRLEEELFHMWQERG